MEEEQLNESLKGAEYEHSIFGSICRIFGFVGIAVSIIMGYQAFKEFNNHQNRELLLKRLAPVGSVAAISAALGSIGTTAKQSKVQSYYLKNLLKNSTVKSEVLKKTIKDQIKEEK